ncbi:hypothetical protein NC653_023541 [Populus alba x Populus x berolinensis]|uniref:Uncharacterized protein n=1 Tax=Populus alba x Populus x berolinensis TaxID=444605 RepID=A0AAD6QB38_9ROSI|nr:hypothetical protein NC653_023541 [Populus alba x Populus x berolinensis]
MEPREVQKRHETGSRMLLKSLVIIGAILGALVASIGAFIPWLFPFIFTSDLDVEQEVRSFPSFY